MIALNIKTQYSLLSSMIQIPELVKRASDIGYRTLAIMDSNLFGAREFMLACEKVGIKPIIGLEVEVDHYVILLYAENEYGYQSLLKLATLKSERSLTLDDLARENNGLLAVVPYASLSYYELINKLYPVVLKGYQTFDERRELDGDLVYIRPIYYLEKQDQEYYPYLEAIRRGVPIREVVKDPLNYALPTKEEYQSIPDMDSFLKIDSMCHLTLTIHKDLLPIYPCPDGKEPYLYLRELCKEGLKRLFGERVNKVYIDRLKYELDIINRMGFCNYFLIVWDYVKYAKDHNILVGTGRGSAAGSLVSYLLNITSIDPIRYQLLFERFLNPERISMPDIDIDFEYNRREEVIQYCINKYGIKRVAGIITFGTLASKQVIRDVGKALEIDLKVIDRVCKMLDSRQSLRQNYQQSETLRTYLKMDPDLIKLYKIGMKLEGLKRHSSVHAAGIVMCRVDLDTIIPLDLNHEGFYTTGYSMEYLEDLGLLKMDFLALRNLTLISDVLEDLNHDMHLSLKFEEIPENDKDAINIFTMVNTVGIFQFESAGMMNFLRKFKPVNFEEVTAAVALFRPGPMNNIDSYIKRRRGLEKSDYIHPDLKRVLEPTYGIMIYQEQIMQVASIMAGYSLGEADILRKAMSKKKEEVMRSEREKFISRSIERGYTKEVSERVYDLIMKFASYGFNRAHSVAYAMIAYRMAYLKAHYPNYFMKALLSMVIGSEVKTKEYIYECKLNHIDILKPDINLSTEEYKIEEFGIRYPLTNIKNVGTSTIKTILEERKKGPFKDIFDVMRRLYEKGVNRKVLESLIAAGVFTSFGLSRQTLEYNLDVLINYGDLMKDLNEEFVEKPELEIKPEYPKSVLMEKELDVFGFYLSNHPVTEYKLKYPNSVAIGDLNKYFDTTIETVVYVEHVKEVLTKKNDKMCFLSGSDELSTIDIVLFPKMYQKYAHVKVGDILLVTAKVEKRYDKLQLVASELLILKEENK